MNTLEIIGGILLIITSIILVIIVLLQDSKSTGLGAITGQGSESYLGKNKGRTRQAMLGRVTKIMAIVFVLVTIAVNAIAVFVK